MRRVLFAVLLLFGFSASARADAIPMPQTFDEFQSLLVGVWQEENYAGPGPNMLGHSSVLRTVSFGNNTFAMLHFGGVSMANDYSGNATVGTWTAERVDDRTIKVTLTQDPEHGTKYLLVFDGDDAFVLTDAEQSYLTPSRFKRVTGRFGSD